MSSLKLTLTVISLILVVSNCFHYFNATNFIDTSEDLITPKLETELQEDLDIYNNHKKAPKYLACLLITRNILAKGSELVTKLISDTKFNKEKVFDKIIVLMILNCKKNISDETTNEIMTPNNILILKEEYHKLVEFDTKKLRSKPKFSDEELEILKGIQDDDDDRDSEEENVVEEKSKPFNSQILGSIFAILAAGLGLLVKNKFS